MWTSKLKLCERISNCFYHACRRRDACYLKLFYGHQCFQRVIQRRLAVNIESATDKIIYNSTTAPKHYLEVFKQKKISRRIDRKTVGTNNPVSLSLIDSKFRNNKITDQNKLSSRKLKPDSKPNLPYQYTVNYREKKSAKEDDSRQELSVRTGVCSESMLVDESIRGAKIWMNDYEKYCKTEETASYDNEWLVNYGTADNDVPMSDVACGGCGAYLHCKDPSIPGYLPSEIFQECKRSELLTLLCQRCHFLKNYNIALSVQVSPDKYVGIISKIKSKALVILLVDLTDTVGSVWPEITEVLGENRPIFLVGNKVDLLWGDRVGWLKHVDRVLRKCVSPKTKIIDSCLISAKTGFGVEELVTKLQRVWKGTDDVYLVGCTNVGKSTLFNSLIQSDYCKTKAVDLVQRATTAPWPGTTLNLLKFPILRPSAWRLAVRNTRLNAEKYRIKAENKLRLIQSQAEKKRLVTPPQLIGNISHTFKQLDTDAGDHLDSFSLSERIKNSEIEGQYKSLVNSKDQDLEGRWCFDTPGVLHKNQILNLLTAEELLLAIPRELIVPRTFLLYEGMSLFIAGLARLDYIKGHKGIRVTVFSSNKLPVTICNLTDSEEVYKGMLGSDLSVVPQGSQVRLKEWLGLTATQPVTLCGVDREESCADVTFSSTGWISVTPEKHEICKLVAWSPLGNDVTVRCPPVLPFAVTLRGKKIPRSPAYSRTRVYK